MNDASNRSDKTPKDKQNPNLADALFKIILIIIAPTALIVAIMSILTLCAYTLNKSWKAAQNIYQYKPDKVISGIARLTAATAGVYYGATKGALLGTFIGSTIPLVGAPMGMLMGAVVGATILAATAVLISKQTARLYAWLRFNDGFYDTINGGQDGAYVISKTNPYKYEITDSQLHSGNTTDIIDTLRALKNQKDAIGWVAVVPFTQASTENEEFNKLLGAIKTGKASKEISFNSGKSLFSWNKEKNQWHIESITKPAATVQAPCFPC